MTGVSIIIPTYNRASFLNRTLQSVARMRCPAGVDREVLVIDNNCTDETASVVAAAAPAFPCRLRHVLETQQGLCFGRNRGIAEAAYEHLVYLDDDIRVSGDWIAGYLDAVDNYGADAVAGPVFPLFEGEKPDYLQGTVLDSICSPYSRKGDAVLVLPEASAHELPGCNFGVTRAAARHVEGFDNTLDRVGGGLLAGGDFDFGRRLYGAGRCAVYHPQCWIEHVMIPEKLTKPYLRQRALGAGMTRRVMYHQRSLSPLQQARYLAGIGRTWMRCIGLRLAGRGCESFAAELDALAAWGFLRAPATQALPAGTERVGNSRRHPPQPQRVHENAGAL